MKRKDVADFARAIFVAAALSLGFALLVSGATWIVARLFAFAWLSR